MLRIAARLTALALCLLGLSTTAAADALLDRPDVPRARPMLALVMDDIGWHTGLGARVLALPAPVTIAVLPDTPAGVELARRAQRRGHEVILHQPMEALDRRDPGPGALRTHHAAADIRGILERNIAAIPGLSGVSNHMGSGLTAQRPAMRAVMETISENGGLYFLDSRTTGASIALSVARDHAIPATMRDVFLDVHLDRDAIEAALDRALALAEQRGHALVIGHPHPETLAVLEARMTEITERVELVPASRLARRPVMARVANDAPRVGTAVPIAE